MKVDIKNSDATEFTQVGVGGCFIFNDEYYIKLCHPIDKYTAVCLSDGIATNIDNNDRIYACNIKVVADDQ